MADTELADLIETAKQRFRDVMEEALPEKRADQPITCNETQKLLWLLSSTWLDVLAEIIEHVQRSQV